jgi:hypothetical protein
VAQGCNCGVQVHRSDLCRLCPGRIIVEVGLGNSWAGPMSAVAFTVAMMALDRSGGGVG